MRLLTKLGLLICLGVIFGLSTAALADQPNTESEGAPVQFLFIHHSCGGQLLADQGASDGASCIYVSHPNGGGLRGQLEAIGYQVNEASYGSIVGDKTDICHWNEKFKTQMDRILSTKNQDELLSDGVTNHIVAFKSCYPNNNFVGEGQTPGDPDSCELTVANAKAAYENLRGYFENKPDVLFVAFTAPPLVEGSGFKGFKGFVKKILGRTSNAGMARQFNNWLVDRENGWLAGYTLNNVAVFDHYDVLTDNGKTDSLAYPTGGGSNSHPSSEGNTKSAEAFVPFIQKALAAHGGAGI